MPSTSRLTTLALAALGALAAGCHPSPEPLRVASRPTQVTLCGDGGCAGDSVQLTYLGVGGFVLRAGDAALMTAPTFSNPGAFDVWWRWSEIESKPERVRAGLRGVPLDGVAAILVGHAHYDHLLDVPTVVREHLPRARVYGSRTMQNILRGDPFLDSVGAAVSIADSAGDATRRGRWVYLEGGRFRILPIRASHAPNWNLGTSRRWSWTIVKDSVPQPLKQLPRRARDWKMGQPYAYVIDVLDPRQPRRPVFRLFYQDAASRRQDNVLPLPEPDDKRIDVAIVCVGSYGNIKRYPTSIIEAYAPRHLVLGHWEDFFRRSSDLKVIIGTNTTALRDTLDGRMKGHWTTPSPGIPLTFLF